jgi:hypothetical protein
LIPSSSSFYLIKLLLRRNYFEPVLFRMKFDTGFLYVSMNKRNSIIITILLTSTCFATAQKTSNASWNNSNKKIDGILNDWPQPVKYINNPAGFQLAFSNDSSALYIGLKITDRMMQMKMMREGLRLFIDPEGRRSENKLIEFPLPLPPAKMPEAGETRPDSFAMKRRVLQNLNTFLASGLTGIPNGNLSPTNPYDVLAATAWDSAGAMTIEYQLPLKSLNIASFNQAISLGLYLPGSNAMNDGFMPPPPGGDMGGPPPGGPGDGGPPPGGDMDGPPPPGIGAFRDSNREFKYWAKVRLAGEP